MTAEEKTVPHEALQADVQRFSDSLTGLGKKLIESARRLRRITDWEESDERLSLLAGSMVEFDNLVVEARRLAKQCKEASNRSFLEIEATIRDLCSKREWRVDGQWPDFIVDYGISIHVDETKRTIAVDGIQTTEQMLESVLTKRVAVLLPKHFSPATFIDRFAEAYDAVRNPSQSQVPILQVYRQLIINSQSARFWRDAGLSTFTPLSLGQFRAQFSRMLEAGISSTPDDRNLILFPPLDPKDAVFVYQPAEHRFGFVGRVELRPH